MDELLKFVAYWLSDAGLDRLTDIIHTNYKVLFYIVCSLLGVTQWKFVGKIKDVLKKLGK